MPRLILFQIINRFDVDFFRIYTAQNEGECGVKLEHETEYILTGMALLMGRDARKPVFGVSDIARLKPACSATKTS